MRSDYDYHVNDNVGGDASEHDGGDGGGPNNKDENDHDYDDDEW